MSIRAARRFALVVFILITTASSAPGAAPRVLVILPQHYGANNILSLDAYEQYGWDITTAGTSKTLLPCPAFAGPLGCRPVTVDMTLDEIRDICAYDAVILGNTTRWIQNPCGDLLGSDTALRLVREAVEQDLVVAGMCVSARVLAKADVVRGVKITGNPHFAAEYSAAGAEYLGAKRLPVIDGRIVTGVRGLCFSRQNAFAIQTAIQRRIRLIEEAPATIKARRIESFRVKRSEIACERFTGTRLTIGGPASETARDLCMAEDGAMIVVGATCSAGSGDSDACVMVVEPDGTLRWSVAVGGGRADVAHGVVLTPDGGCICVGSTFSTGGDNAMGLLFRLNAAGELVWARTHGGRSVDMLRDVCALGDDRYVAVGSTQSKGEGEDDMWIVRFDGDGKSISDIAFGTAESDVADASCTHPEGGFVVAGTRNSDPPGNRDTFIARFAGKDEPVFSHRHGTPIPQEFEEVAAIRPLPGGGFLIIGRQDHPDQRTGELMNVLALRVDDAGAVRWRNTYGVDSFYDFGCDALPAEEGGALLLGRTKDAATREDDVLLIDVDAGGAMRWLEQLKMDGDDHAAALAADRDGRIVIAGDHKARGARDRNMQVLVLEVRVPDPKDS
jgi:hypothetical protein